MNKEGITNLAKPQYDARALKNENNEMWNIFKIHSNPTLLNSFVVALLFNSWGTILTTVIFSMTI